MIGFSRGGINPLIFNGALDSDRNVFRLNGFVATDGNKLDSSEVWSYYESDEYRQSAEIAKRWYDMGMIPTYILSNGSQADAEFYNANALFTIGASYRVFEYQDIVNKVNPNVVFKNYYLGDKTQKPLMSRGAYSTAFAVSANVEGEELVGYVKLINLFQSSQEWVDFILYGVEGKDYNWAEDGTMEMINTDVLVDTWLPDNINFKRYPAWVTDEQKDTYENWNEGCIPQKDIGFAFDLTPVSTEYAQLQAVEQEYFNPITAGIISYEDNIDEAIKRLKDAGIDAFVAEYQRQFDEFINSKNQKGELKLAIYHVSKNGSDKNNGSFDAPFLTIQKAADMAASGDKIIVHEGVYREWVKPRNGGLSDSCRIIYEAAEGERVIIK